MADIDRTGAADPRTLRPPHKVRAAVNAILQSHYVGITVGEKETSTGSPMLTVTLPDGVVVNITFTEARS